MIQFLNGVIPLGSQMQYAGGRHDSLVENMGGECVPAIAFAIGIER